MSIQTKDDDLDDEMSVANTSEQDVDLNAFSSGRSQDNRLDNDTVQNYDGRSEVGNKKKFSGGNAPLMFLLIAMAIGLVGYGIYYAKNMSLGAKGEVEEEVSQDENPANTRQRDFNKEFEQFQSVETQKQQNAELIAASGGANAEGQSMGQSMNNGVEPVNPQYNQADYQSQQPYNPQPNQQTAPQSQAPVLTPEQERMQRLLGSSFTGQSGSMNAAKRDTGKDNYESDSAEQPPQSKGGLASRMGNVSVFSATKAGMMGNRDLTLDKGSFIDCILTTRFNSQLAGMLTCETSRNIYSASGRVILIERGSKVTGQYQGDIENGQARVFVMWDRIVTPKGVGININSPAASALGESGLTGRINTHFWRNLGNAFMVSLVGSTADATGDSIGKAIGKKLDKILGNPQGSSEIDISSGSSSSGSPSDVAMKSLDQIGKTVPTITKHQGDRVTIFVARDIDFSNVYTLR